MRIAFVNSTRKWGGVKTWTLEAAASLNGLGCETVVYGRPGPFIERALAMGLDAREAGFGFDGNPAAVGRFVRDFSRQGVQAVLVNVGKDLRSAGAAGRLLGIPVIQRLGLPSDVKNTFRARLDQRLIGQRFLTTCQYIKDGFLARFPAMDPDRLTVIHTGKHPAPQPPRRVRRPLRLVTTSQLTADKGHADVLDALSGLKSAGLDFSWDVAGTGPLAEGLARHAKAVELADRVTFHGFTHNVAELLRRSDVFVLPSLDEGLPNTLLEAMAQGLVPLARNVGGVAELWPQECADLLIPPDPGPNRLQRALRKVLQAGDAAVLAWKTAAWRTCCERFHQDRQAQALLEYFRYCVQAR